jgi:hypothetical protein
VNGSEPGARRFVSLRGFGDEYIVAMAVGDEYIDYN